MRFGSVNDSHQLIPAGEQWCCNKCPGILLPLRQIAQMRMLVHIVNQQRLLRSDYFIVDAPHIIKRIMQYLLLG